MEERKIIETPAEATVIEEEIAPTDRRGFLRQAAMAGMGSAALALLLGAGGAQRAEASNAGDMFSSELVTVELNGANALNFSTFLGGVNREAHPISQGGSANFTYFADGFPPSTVPIWGVWYQPYDNIQNLTQYKTIKLAVDKATAQVGIDVTPTQAARDAAKAPNGPISSLTLLVTVLHGPF